MFVTLLVILMRKLVGLIAIILIALVASGCIGGSDNDENTLVVGTDATYPPMEYINDDGEFAGFDVDFAKALADELGMDVEFINSDWAGIIPSLNADKFDIIISSMTINETRMQEVNFSDPYFYAGQVIVVAKDNDTIFGEEDLSGMSVGVQLGTTGDVYCTEMGDVDVRRYNKIGDAVMDLINGNVDAVVSDNSVCLPFVADNPEDLKAVEGLLTVESYGMAISKDNTALLEQVNAALATMMESGAYDDVYSAWFGE